MNKKHCQLTALQATIFVLPTHCSVRLCDTTAHTTEQTSRTGADSLGPCNLFNLGSGEKQYGTLGRCLNPGLTRILDQSAMLGDAMLDKLTHGMRP
jgi:hypothetical protein